MTPRDFGRYIYFIAPADKRMVKIGSSISPIDRMESLASWSPDPLHLLAFAPGTNRDEIHIHWLFREHHSHHEWFRPTDKLLNLVEAVRCTARLPAYALWTQPIPNAALRGPRRHTAYTPEWRAKHGEIIKGAWAARRSRLAERAAI